MSEHAAVRAPRCIAVLAALLIVASACGDDTVRLTYQPKAGDRSEYEVTVRSESVVRIPGQPERRQDDQVVLRAEHVVLAADRSGTRLRIRLRRADAGPAEAREFVVRFDRAAQLAEVEEVEGLPARILGDLGLAEIFPAAAGTPPDRRLEPGERWEIVDSGDGSAEPAKGRGRLASLGLDGGRDIGIVETVLELPVARTGSSADGLFRLVGEQYTDSRTAHDLSDGSIRWSEAETVGKYELSLTPGEQDLPAVRGSLRVRVESKTRRLS